jgi:hypothetical protein
MWGRFISDPSRINSDGRPDHGGQEEGGEQGQGGMTKLEAVRQALEAMGSDAKPLAI